MGVKVNILKELGIKHGTDKANRHPYMDEVYWPLFKGYQNKEVNILEIGAGRFGGSVKTWKDFFVNGQVYLMDPFFIKGSDHIGPFSVSRKNVEDYGVIAIQSNQLSKEQSKDVTEICSEKFDFIIDDGAHMNDAIQYSFAALFPLLKSGGSYIIEDLWTAKRRTPKSVNNWLDNSGHVFCEKKLYHVEEVHFFESIDHYSRNKKWKSLLLSDKEREYIEQNIKDYTFKCGDNVCIIIKR